LTVAFSKIPNKNEHVSMKHAQLLGADFAWKKSALFSGKSGILLTAIF
jgi:hypothetical protein